jgi:hypothetical protein
VSVAKPTEEKVEHKAQIKPSQVP